MWFEGRHGANKERTALFINVFERTASFVVFPDACGVWARYGANNEHTAWFAILGHGGMVTYSSPSPKGT